MILNRLWGYLAGAGVVLAALLTALGTAFLRGRKAGQQAARERIVKDNAKLQEKFNEIDSERPDLDGALGRLRARSGGVRNGRAKGNNLRPTPSRPPSFHSGRVGGKR